MNHGPKRVQEQLARRSGQGEHPGLRRTYRELSYLRDFSRDYPIDDARCPLPHAIAHLQHLSRVLTAIVESQILCIRIIKNIHFSIKVRSFSIGLVKREVNSLIKGAKVSGSSNCVGVAENGYLGSAFINVFRVRARIRKKRSFFFF